MDSGKYYWKKLNQAIKDSGDPTARQNQMNVWNGTERFQEWSKRRLAHLRARAARIIEGQHVKDA